ncbi:hypothetical protein [Phormidium sp. CCY1219]|uniref:hypothetical protein n=1 Tax=Phormidium sp. CCY1219 TaxID=2886104 RepID=UPI002D1ED5FD|nr:hypothetical protein [Phormidium sp. CCY1219]MEB3829029.1 hypothetical protein [Phormidium sp. CCY1219]
MDRNQIVPKKTKDELRKILENFLENDVQKKILQLLKVEGGELNEATRELLTYSLTAYASDIVGQVIVGIAIEGLQVWKEIEINREKEKTNRELETEKIIAWRKLLEYARENDDEELFERACQELKLK